jgi:hypothetical protein
MAALLVLPAGPTLGAIEGITGTTFDLTVKEGYVSFADGGSVYSWGYAVQAPIGNHKNVMQHPGPTLILNQGDPIEIHLINELPGWAGNVSMVFPGLAVTASGGMAGALTREAPPGGTTTVTYTFTADRPGTFQYHSGTDPTIQVEMGLVGAIIVRPNDQPGGEKHAYSQPNLGMYPNAPRSRFDREYLFLITEMDPAMHELVEQGRLGEARAKPRLPQYWMFNGRAAPDTLLSNYAAWLPHQPYNCLPLMEPGELLLKRLVVSGRDLHPHHPHGNHSKIIARDGRLLESAPGAGPDLAFSLFTITTIPGETVDALFEWTGEGLNWDIYGTGEGYEHTCNGLAVTDCTGVAPDACRSGPGTPNPALPKLDPVTREYCGDHGKPIPVALPGLQDVTFGGFYSGSPFLGDEGAVPPGEGGLNPFAAFTFMWHSHAERELTNFDIFPGGLMTMLFVVPPGTLGPEIP